MIGSEPNTHDKDKRRKTKAGDATQKANYNDRLKGWLQSSHFGNYFNRRMTI